MTVSAHMTSEMPSQEAFDAMNDAQFCDWWDAREEAVGAACNFGAEFDECEEQRAAAEMARWSV